MSKYERNHGDYVQWRESSGIQYLFHPHTSLSLFIPGIINSTTTNDNPLIINKFFSYD